MRRLILALPLLIALPAFGQQAEDEGFSLMEEGAKLILRGMMSEMEPAFDEMERALDEMEPMLKDLGPQFADLMAMMGDVTNYHAPEMLDNGDILIRRKGPLPVTPLAPGLPTLPGPNGEVEL